MKTETPSILKIRAASMAEEPVKSHGPSASIQVIEFILGTETYGIESVFVKEVYLLKDFTPLPDKIRLLYATAFTV